MKTLHKLVWMMAALAFSYAGPAFGGAASSMGGLFLTDSLNPWYVQNTSEIHYCLAIDSAQFHLSPDLADAEIHEAFAAWQNEFSRVEFENVAPLTEALKVPRLATQTLVKVDCQANPDLVFQLGSLEEAQKPLVPDLDHTIALTVRTSYDTVHLRAKGFIYISGDAGPGPKPDAASGLQRWSVSDNAAFYLVVVHELGHIFGLPDSAVDDSTIMSYGFAQYVLRLSRFPQNAALLKSLRSPQVFSQPYKISDVYSIVQHTAASEQRARDLGFNLAPGTHVLCVRVQLDGSKLDLLVGSASGLQGGRPCARLQHIGHAELELKTVHHRRMPMVRMWLPPEQKVFAVASDSSDGTGWPLIYRYPVIATGQYWPQSGAKPVPVTLEWQAGQEEGLPRLSAVIRGQLVPDLLAPLVESH